MRFDDSLTTVLSADAASGFGAEATWRQLVDLMGRGRIAADEPTVARLRMLRGAVTAAVRGASARALAYATPPAWLVGFFAEDDLAIAAPVLRTATLDANDWLALLPRLSPARRSVLRNRRDLPIEAVRGLESFGAIDLVLDFSGGAHPTASEPATPRADQVARDLPPLLELTSRSEVPPQREAGNVAGVSARLNEQGSQSETVPASRPAAFRFETDATGTIRWVEGVTRATLVGVSLEHAAPQGLAQLDATTAGAFRQRTNFSAARLEVGGTSDAAGSWRISGVPAFDPATGRFTGFRGAARRPRVDEIAAREHGARSIASDSLRQLVHELRTPTNAIAGFAELIETELLGPVAQPYRGRAGAIRTDAAGLIAAIDDLDMAARIEGKALELRPSRVAVGPLLSGVIDDLAPLARLRNAIVVVESASPDLVIAGDDRAVERLIGRLTAALVSAAGPGERIGVSVASDGGAAVLIRFDRPAALAMQSANGLFTVDADREADVEGAPLLGTGFALRLAQNLATELGGALVIEAAMLTLRLPAADAHAADRATSS